MKIMQGKTEGLTTWSTLPLPPVNQHTEKIPLLHLLGIE